MLRVAILMFVTSQLVGSVLVAQTTDSATTAFAELHAGDRLRIHSTADGSRRMKGTFGDISHDTLLIVQRGQAVAVPIGAVAKVETSAGWDRGRGAAKGLQYGVVVGAAGLATLIFLGPPDCDYCLPGRHLGAAAVGAVIGGVLGLVPGAVLGAIIGVEKWRLIYSQQPAF